jgi:small conductance mechanosensitive channel
MDLANIDLSALSNTVLAWAPKLVAAIVVLIIGFWIVGMISKMIGKSLTKSGIDKDLIPFLQSLVSVLLKVMVVITAAGVVGVEVTAFAALIAGAGLAIGAAMSGTLSHFAAGVMVLIFKPYRVGDLVDIQGTVGHVEGIQVFNTIIKTLDNKKVIMPNGIATSGIMTNLTANGKLRVDLNVAMPYEEDFGKIQNIIKGALNNVKERLPDEPTIEIEKFDESNILLAVRPFATDETYWDVYFNSYKEIKNAFAKEGIEVAYPTRRNKAV